MKMWWMNCGYCFVISSLNFFFLAILVLDSMYMCVWKCVLSIILVFPLLHIKLLLTAVCG